MCTWRHVRMVCAQAKVIKMHSSNERKKRFICLFIYVCIKNSHKFKKKKDANNGKRYTFMRKRETETERQNTVRLYWFCGMSALVALFNAFFLTTVLSN